MGFKGGVTSLAVYLSHALCEDNRHDRQEVLKSLLEESEFSSRYRNAKRKHKGIDEELVCRAILLDWMKTKAVHDDKLFPIMVALKRTYHDDIAESCEEFVKFQKENLSDAVLSDIATHITKDVHTVGQALGMASEKVEKCIRDHSDNVGQALGMASEKVEKCIRDHSDNVGQALGMASEKVEKCIRDHSDNVGQALGMASEKVEKCIRDHSDNVGQDLGMASEKVEKCIRDHSDNVGQALGMASEKVEKCIRDHSDNVGQSLGMASEKVEKCIRDHSDNVQKQYLAILSEWRESEDVIRHGEKAVDYLENVCF